MGSVRTSASLTRCDPMGFLLSFQIPEAFLRYDLSGGAVDVLEQEEVLLRSSGEFSTAHQQGRALSSNAERNKDSVHSQSTIGSLLNLSCLYLCTRKEATSYDGVSVPITIVHSRKLKLDSQSPTLLVGYGAYCEPLEVDWSSDQLSLLDRGWVLAFAHVRYVLAELSR